MLKIAGITIPSEAQYLEYINVLSPIEDSSWWLQDANHQVRGTVKTALGRCIMPMAPLIERGVRPALVLADARPVRSKFSFAGMNWTVCSSISKTSFAICDTIIACRRFDPESNIWEKSELKIWLEEWLEYVLMGVEDVVYSGAPFSKKPGEICRIGKYDMIVLEDRDGKCLLLSRDIYSKNVCFGVTNCFSGSIAEQVCVKFAKEIEDAVGSENIITHSVDLISHDKHKDYSCVNSKVSLLTENMYEKYEDIIEPHRVDDWWWLATPSSTPAGGGVFGASCISPFGILCSSCSEVRHGIRPFCVVKSSALAE